MLATKAVHWGDGAGEGPSISPCFSLDKMFPWSQKCLEREKIVAYNVEENNSKGFFDAYNVTYTEVHNAESITKTFFDIKKVKKTCNNGTNGFYDVNSEEYKMTETVVMTLMAIVLVGGILAVLSNTVVLFFGLKKKVFPAPILTLAFNDLLNGLLGTPLVMAIYYTSEYVLLGILSLHVIHTYKIFSEHTRDKNDPCTNQMKAFLTTANGSTNWYDYKWILPNILKVSSLPFNVN